MSSPKPAKIGVQISKETGGAYADVREVIESEIARIRAEWQQKTNTAGQGQGQICDPDAPSATPADVRVEDIPVNSNSNSIRTR